MSNYESNSEAQLLDLIKAGNYAAFNEIYQRHWDELFGLAYNILRDREACMDIIQDIFVWFWENRSEWTLSSSKGYLITAVKFKTANYIRNNKFRASVINRLSSISIKSNELEILEVRQLEELIKSISSGLPERCREIFKLSRYEYLSNKEIACKLSISEKTVESQITIALKRLRQKLSASYFFLFL